MRRGLRAGWIVAAAMAAWGVGAPASAQEGNVGVALDRAYERFSQAYRDGDPGAVAALYADDAFYLAPGRDMTRGEVARHFEWLSSFEPGSGPRIEFEIVDRDVEGDLAYDIGYYAIGRAEAPEGERSRGKFVVIWKRGEDGSWRIHADGFSDVPGPEEEGS
ncbi:MAG TPA: nuclear transport factor 2 family protein [Gemmatimonadota bacterium]|nr:nuclear transport factor 2 family protein [Gemmatimonadota bacterium]